MSFDRWLLAAMWKKFEGDLARSDRIDASSG